MHQYRDYVTAALLGSSQSKTAYQDFRNGYLYTERVTIEDIKTAVEDDEVIVTVIISAEERQDGQYQVNKYKTVYRVGYENDQLKILSGKGEKL